MNDFPPIRVFRLSPGGIECDEEGLRVGDVALLARDKKGGWAARDERDLGFDLSRVYGFPIDVTAKMAALGAVASALRDRNIAKAQIAALLLRLPDPLPLADALLDKSGERRLSRDLVACGLLKADDGWDDKHPRTGSPPNPGWFAPKPKESQADEPPKAAAKPNESASSHSAAPGGELAFVPSALATGADSLLAENLSAVALDGLAMLAARVSVPTILFGAIFIPNANRIVDEGAVPGRPDMIYRWAHDETRVTFKALIDGQWRTLIVGALGQGHAFYSPDGEMVARMVLTPGRRRTLVITADALDRALADFRRVNGEPAANPADDDHEPKLCPSPTPEPKTAQSANSIAYQEYVSKLPYGWAINVGDVNFDGCDPQTGDLLEAKADIDFMFDENDKLYDWVKSKKNPAIQMERQANKAAAAGRIVVWHAQTEKGYRGLSEIGKTNLFVVYDPN
ncbi:Tox-REase-5 domain-containing protein [Methylocapsa sp. S129]|uniref:Tox-REase-5 domain-containing protein n=1 Tax=Methylocapsa sp. S129 TaxID=1641869 RepID=UPI00131E217B|nr:Tox-REase-5 domain-containing protein [Methylocapsa sp. S129]